MLKTSFNIVVGMILCAMIAALPSCRDSSHSLQVLQRAPESTDADDKNGNGDAETDEDPASEPESDPSGASEPPSQPIATGDVEFPLTMSFRAEETLGDGILTGQENFDFIHTGSKETVNAFLADSSFDDQKIIFHGSFAAASTNYYNEIYAGHWLFEPGTTLTSSASATATTLSVADANVFEVGDYCMISYRDSTGERQWDIVEEVVVTNVDTSSHKIEVTRGQFGTATPRWSRSTGTIVITPHVYMTPQTISTNWSLNVSLGSPKNSDGEEGWEFFGRWEYETFWVDKMSEQGDGIELDSARWVYDNSKFPVDADNDGTADYGFKDGVNVFGLGAVKAIAKMRELLPENAILQLDSSLVEDGFRSPAHLNGIEMESFPAIENYDQYSASLNHLFQWVAHTDATEKLSYPFTKDDTETFQCDPTSAAADASDLEINNYFRIGFASALIVGVPHAYIAETSASDAKCFNAYEWDEYKGGTLNDWHWLGKPYGSAKQSSSHLGTVNYLENSGWEASDKNSVLPDASDIHEYTSYTASSEKLILNVTRVPHTVVERDDGKSLFPAVDGISMVTNTALDTGTHSAYTVTFSASSLNTYNSDTDYAEFSKIPRLLTVKLVTPTDSYRQRVLVWEDTSEFSIGFNLDTPDQIESVEFLSGEETGIITIQDIKMVSGNSDRWIRYFEGGAVILNMTDSAWDVDLNANYSAKGFERLAGTQDPEINSGESGSGSNKTGFTVPAFDALLVKIRE